MSHSVSKIKDKVRGSLYKKLIWNNATSALRKQLIPIMPLMWD